MKTTTFCLALAASLIIGPGLTSCIAPVEAYGNTTNNYYEPGYRINSLPRGYRTEEIDGRIYFYHEGIYYRREGRGYVVVRAPRDSRYQREHRNHHRNNDGRVIRQLPRQHRSFTYRGVRYFEAGNRYYRRHGEGFIEVRKPN